MGHPAVDPEGSTPPERDRVAGLDDRESSVLAGRTGVRARVHEVRELLTGVR